MLDSECRERTEIAESERRGVLMGGYTETGNPSGGFVQRKDWRAQQLWATFSQLVLSGTTGATAGAALVPRLPA